MCCPFYNNYFKKLFKENSLQCGLIYTKHKSRLTTVATRQSATLG